MRDTLELAPTHRIGWITSIERELVVDADPDQLLRVLLNLARNAVQALETRAPNDPARDQVRITGRREGAPWWWSRSPTPARAFPAKAREHLFKPFQSSARSGGRGLGPRHRRRTGRGPWRPEIVLVEGTIGATFRFTIPDQAVDSRPAARPGQGPEPGLYGLTSGIGRSPLCSAACSVTLANADEAALRPRSAPSCRRLSLRKRQAPVAQLDRALDYRSRGQEFDLFGRAIWVQNHEHFRSRSVFRRYDQPAARPCCLSSGSLFHRPRSRLSLSGYRTPAGVGIAV